MLTSLHYRIGGLEKDIIEFNKFLEEDEPRENHSNQGCFGNNLIIYNSPDWSSLVSISTKDLALRGISLENISIDALWNELDICNYKYEDVFTLLNKRDIAVSFIAGIAGTITSNKLLDPLSKVHGLEYRKDNNPILWNIQNWLKHSGSPMDKVRGRKHRLKFGHDILNPFEVWSELVETYGGNFKAALHWIKHLTADSLSIEGVPLPGHSLFREFLVENLSPEEFTAYLGVKTRDLLGASLTASILKAYFFLCRQKYDYSTKPNYQFYLSHMIAYSTCLITGLMLGSLNYGSLVLFGKNVIQSCLYDLKISNDLSKERANLLKQITSSNDASPSLEELISGIQDDKSFDQHTWSKFTGLTLVK